MMAAPTYAALCEISTTCTGTVIYRMSDTSNAHISLANETDYGVKVCCSKSGTGETILHISNNTDAHAEQRNESNYLLNITMGLYYTCNYSATCGARLCLGSISDNTNAHVGDCSADPYSTFICCDYSEPSTPVVDESPGGGGGGGGPTKLVDTNISCQYGFTKQEYLVGETAYFTFSCPELEGFKFMATWRAINGTILRQELSRLGKETTISYTPPEPMDGILDFQVVNYKAYSAPFRAAQAAFMGFGYIILAVSLIGLGIGSYRLLGGLKRRADRLKAITDEDKERD